MTRQTKSQQIMDWHALGKTAREIAQEVYGDTSDKRQAYVRIVTRQRQGGKGAAPADIKWRTSHAGIKSRAAAQQRFNVRRTQRYHTDPAYREKRRAQAIAWYAANRSKMSRKESSCAALTNQ